MNGEIVCTIVNVEMSCRIICSIHKVGSKYYGRIEWQAIDRECITGETQLPYETRRTTTKAEAMKRLIKRVYSQGKGDGMVKLQKG